MQLVRTDIDHDHHGRAIGYKSGCRCILCRMWNTAKAREYRQKQKRQRDLGHLDTWTRSADLGWTEQAACYGQDTQLWFAGDGRNSRSSTTQQAIAICDGCPVRADCLQYALEIPTPWHGIFGGMTPQERRAEYIHRYGHEPHLEGPNDDDTTTGTATADTVS